MRLALLLALLVRLAPLPAGSAHCAATAAVPASHGPRHEMPTGAEHPADCPHCPPSECATAVACAMTLPAALVQLTAWQAPPMPAVAPVRLAGDRWSSRDHRPPVPPPVVAVT